jgi:hypothetical protein
MAAFGLRRRFATLVAASLSSLVIALAPAPARADDAVAGGPVPASPSPWVDQGATVPLPTATAAIPDPSTAAAVIEAESDPAEAAPAPSRARKWGSLGGVIGVYAAATTYMYFAWYYGQPGLANFKWGGDGYFGEETYAGGADKVGHAWANAFWSRIPAEILLWGGWSRKQAAAIASGMTLALFTYVEVKDGLYYQFSPGDQIANMLGAGLTAVLVNYPRVDDLIDFRVEYFPSRQYLDLLDGKRPPEDPTMPHQTSLNFVEDYSGQRYLLALHLGALPWLEEQRWAKLVDVAVGFETRGYKPTPVEEGVEREQHLFLGLSLNLQGVFDTLLGDQRSGAGKTVRQMGHGVFEVFNAPFTSAALLGPTRSPDR